jgi:hypothetical protein
MNAPIRTTTRCLVCGFTEIRTDEVVDRGIVLLAECPRCRHQWTMRSAPGRTRETTPLSADAA